MGLPALCFNSNIQDWLEDNYLLVKIIHHTCFKSTVRGILHIAAWKYFCSVRDHPLRHVPPAGVSSTKGGTMSSSSLHSQGLDQCLGLIDVQIIVWMMFIAHILSVSLGFVFAVQQLLKHNSALSYISSGWIALASNFDFTERFWVKIEKKAYLMEYEACCPPSNMHF